MNIIRLEFYTRLLLLVSHYSELVQGFEIQVRNSHIMRTMNLSIISFFMFTREIYMRIKLLSALIFSTVLSGCGIFGPSYSKPNVSAAAKWRSQDNLSKVSDDMAKLPDMAWWNKFHDPKLNELIILALKNNNQIQQAIGNITTAQGLLQQIQMLWVPNLSIVPSYTQGGGSFNSGSNTFSTGTSSGYSAGLIPSYNSLNVLQLYREQQQAKASLAAYKAAKDVMRLTIISQLVGSYFTLVEQNYILELYKQLVQDTGDQYKLAKDQYKDGYISLLSLQNSEQTYEAAKAQIPIAENNIVISENAIKVLINKNPGVVKPGAKFTQLPMTGIIPGNVPSTVLKQRPDVVEAEEQLIAANAGIGVATANFFPSINLTGGLGTASSQLSGLFGSGSDFWSTSVNATMPILNLSYFGTIRQAKGAYYQAYYNYIFTVRSAFADVDSALSGHQKTMDSYKEQKQVYDSTVLSFQLGTQRLNDGLDSLPTMLNYKVSMDNAGITLAGYKMQQLQSSVNLYQAMAGGYNVDNTYTPNKFGDGHDAD